MVVQRAPRTLGRALAILRVFFRDIPSGPSPAELPKTYARTTSHAFSVKVFETPVPLRPPEPRSRTGEILRFGLPTASGARMTRTGARTKHPHSIPRGTPKFCSVQRALLTSYSRRRGNGMDLQHLSDNSTRCQGTDAKAVKVKMLMNRTDPLKQN